MCSPAELVQIQMQLGISLKDTNPEVIRHIADQSKQAGNDAFKRQSYKGACGPGRRSGPDGAWEAEETRPSSLRASTPPP